MQFYYPLEILFMHPILKNPLSKLKAQGINKGSCPCLFKNDLWLLCCYGCYADWLEHFILRINGR